MVHYIKVNYIYTSIKTNKYVKFEKSKVFVLLEKKVTNITNSKNKAIINTTENPTPHQMGYHDIPNEKINGIHDIRL